MKHPLGVQNVNTNHVKCDSIFQCNIKYANDNWKTVKSIKRISEQRVFYTLNLSAKILKH